MIHWYRAALRFPSTREDRMIRQPTLLIWAEDDAALDKSLTYGLEAWVPDLAIHYIPNCGHWVQNEAPDEVNRLMVDFIT
jgi:pimeloyl-ACP methyl ester carboxylesterase